MRFKAQLGVLQKLCRSTVEPVLATTWQKRPPENCGHTISVPSICGFKCTECVLENATTWEMRIADTKGRPKASIQPEKSDHTRQIERKALLCLSKFSFVGTSNERSSRLIRRPKWRKSSETESCWYRRVNEQFLQKWLRKSKRNLVAKKARTYEWVIVTYGRFLVDRRAPRVTKATYTFWSQPKARETL